MGPFLTKEDITIFLKNALSISVKPGSSNLAVDIKIYYVYNLINFLI